MELKIDSPGCQVEKMSDNTVLNSSTWVSEAESSNPKHLKDI